MTTPHADAAVSLPAGAPISTFHATMGERSATLQRMLRAHGYVKGDGVATAGLRLVSQLAATHNLRAWPDTRTVADYDALIQIVGQSLTEMRPN